MTSNVLILGTPGQMARILITQALERNYNVTTLVTNPNDLMLSHPDLEIVKGEVQNYSDMKSVIAGQDVVIWAFEDANAFAVSIGSQNMILGMKEWVSAGWFVCHPLALVRPLRERVLLLVFCAISLATRFYLKRKLSRKK